ncbi:MAG: hypothetical protein EXR89_06960 [Methylococcaceae bacterium]|nr:hypothetical protein [Methylococcaceae bacterium]
MGFTIFLYRFYALFFAKILTTRITSEQIKELNTKWFSEFALSSAFWFDKIEEMPWCFALVLFLWFSPSILVISFSIFNFFNPELSDACIREIEHFYANLTMFLYSLF